jgi:hypothetical protein
MRPLKPFDRNITMLESGPPDYDWAWGQNRRFSAHPWVSGFG